MEKELSDKLHGGDNDFESLMEQSLPAPVMCSPERFS